MQLSMHCMNGTGIMNNNGKHNAVNTLELKINRSGSYGKDYDSIRNTPEAISFSDQF